jgi:two-component system alkaline phosphatase synthesis response regulator PhoP
MNHKCLNVLCAEGEAGVCGVLTKLLRPGRYVIESCADGLEAQFRATSDLFQMIILDAMLPLRNGFEVCRYLRQNAVHAPILVLGTRDLNQKIDAFAAGCDDYLAKPFDLTELQLRVEALMRRVYKYASRPLTSYELNETHIDFVRGLVVKGGEQTNLRKRECAVLRYLIERRGRVVTRDELLQAVWGYTCLLQTRIVDIHIRFLRKKIESQSRSPEFIKTVHGEGYRFEH